MLDNFIMIQFTFPEIFVPQDSLLGAAPGLIGPANTCGALKPVTAKMFLPQNTIFFLSFYVWVQKVIVSEFFSMSLALCCGIPQLFGLVATGLDAKTTYTMGLYASAFC